MKKTIEDEISIITVVLNGATEIEETIKSVINQENVNIEYIIIDGGSTDGTIEKIAFYNKYIKYFISEPDNGLYHAINKGLSMASYPLIGLIHCGDYYSTNALSKVIKVFKDSNADVIYGNIQIRDEYSTKIYYKKLIANHEMLKTGMSIFHPATFVKRVCYQELGYYSTAYRLAADYDLFLNYFLLQVQFIHIPEVLAVFRSGGISSSNFVLSLKENYLIRKRRLGVKSAFKYGFIRVSYHIYFITRKMIIQMLIGKERYFNIKKNGELFG